MNTEKKTGRKKIGYKVIRRYPNGQLWSYMCAGLSRELHTEYLPDARTVPNEGCGPLAVFTTEGAAENFALCMGEPHAEIWECTYTPSRVRALWGPDGLRVDSHWDHSAYASSVTLTRKVV